MHILITGAAGMVGRKLTERLVADGGLNGKSIDRLTLVDVVAPAKPAGFSGKVDAYALDVSREDAAASWSRTGPTRSSISPRWCRARPRPISRRATASTWSACTTCSRRSAARAATTRSWCSRRRSRCSARRSRARSTTSSTTRRSTSYGTQKGICELLLADYTRKGFLDGVGIRLPTICVRPGTPNKAASGFFSNIIREPLAGKEAVLPVEESVMHWHASPRSAVGFLMHAAALTREQLGPRINLTMPGVACTVGEQIAALRRVAGENVVARIRREPDAAIMKIVSGWPTRFDAKRARALGFKVEDTFDQIIRAHVDDELAGKIAA